MLFLNYKTLKVTTKYIGRNFYIYELWISMYICRIFIITSRTYCIYEST